MIYKLENKLDFRAFFVTGAKIPFSFSTLEKVSLLYLSFDISLGEGFPTLRAKVDSAPSLQVSAY
jgi:hypothetical protein